MVKIIISRRRKIISNLIISFILILLFILSSILFLYSYNVPEVSLVTNNPLKDNLKNNTVLINLNDDEVKNLNAVWNETNIIENESINITNLDKNLTYNNSIDENSDEIRDKYDVNSVTKKLLLKYIPKVFKLKDFNELRVREELHSALWKEVFGEPKSNNIDDILNYKKNLIDHSSFLLQTNFTEMDENQKLLAASHQSLYSWIYGYKFNSFSQLMESSNGRGIVMCTGDYHFSYARSVIDSLRNILNCTLPIEIFYIGDDDLSVENRHILSEFSDIYFTDITTFFDNNVVNLSGWAVKPFAILGSRFEEVILMDADVIFVRNPIELFDEPGYIKTGTLFYKDRTTESNIHSLKWLKSWMNDPLPETEKLRFWNGESYHEMESGTVVIHKTKTILGLLNTCKLNEYNYRQHVVYRRVHGDKETFWMGFDMARQHYYMDPEPCSFIGEYQEARIRNKYEKLLCGHIAHTKNGRLLFWNSHIVKEKNSEYDKNIILNLNGYYTETGPMEWANFADCLKLGDDKKPIPFNEEEEAIINEIIDREVQYHFVVPEEDLFINNEFLRNRYMNRTNTINN